MSDDLPDTPTSPAHPELGFYTLAGAAAVPADARPPRCDDGRGPRPRHGLHLRALQHEGGGDAARAAAGAVTESIAHRHRAPPTTTPATRIVTAGTPRTMHRLTGGRFTLGLGRGIDPMLRRLGIPRITTAQMEDFVGLMRRLWHGEVIIGHDGPAGSWPVLHLDADVRRATSRCCSSPSDPRPWRSAAAASTRSCCTPSSPTRPPPRCVTHGEGRGRAGRPRPRRRSRCGRASPPSATTCPRTCA